MARTKQVTEIVSDDLDGSTRNVQTIAFAIEGTTYEIDLGPKNAKEMRKQFALWAEHGRKVAKASSARRKPAAKRASSGRRKAAAKNAVSRSAEIREWAAANGITVPARGRISSSVVEQYNAAP